MTTVINNPGENNGGSAASGGSGVVIGAVLVILVLIGALVLALPYIRERTEGIGKIENPTINVQAPTLPATTVISATTTTQ